MAVLCAVNWQCFGTKKQVLHKGTYGIIITFSEPGTVLAREGKKEQRTGNSATFMTGDAETRGL